MKQNRGIALIFAVIILMILTLVVSSMLMIAQLSHKASQAGQQQLVISRQALNLHLSQINSLQQNEVDETVALSSCPAQYAAWSGGILKCELIEINTQSHSDNQLFYNSFSSLVLKQDLAKEPD